MIIDEIPDTIERYFDALLTEDREALESLLSSDFTYTSPHDDRVDRHGFFERAWPLAGNFEYHDLKAVMTDGDMCFVLYEGKPRGDRPFRQAELFELERGRIRSIEAFVGRPPKVAALIPFVRGARRDAPVELTPSGV